jgi:hypothetical protein
MVGLKMAKYSGSGWHHQSTRHSNARKYGKAGGKYAIASKFHIDVEFEGRRLVDDVNVHEKPKPTDKKVLVYSPQLRSNILINKKDLKARTEKSIEDEMNEVKGEINVLGKGQLINGRPFNEGTFIDNYGNEYTIFINVKKH